MRPARSITAWVFTGSDRSTGANGDGGGAKRIASIVALLPENSRSELLLNALDRKLDTLTPYIGLAEFSQAHVCPARRRCLSRFRHRFTVRAGGLLGWESPSPEG